MLFGKKTDSSNRDLIKKSTIWDIHMAKGVRLWFYCLATCISS